MKKIFIYFFLLFSFSILGKERVTFFKPNYGWAVEVPFKGFEITASLYSEEDNFKFEAYNKEEKTILDIYFEKGAPNAVSTKVREYYKRILKEGEGMINFLEEWDKDNNSYIMYLAKGVIEGNPPKDELNCHFYRSKGMSWIDVRVRIQEPKEGDIKKVKDFINNVKFIEAFEPTPEENIFMGNLYCLSTYGDFCISCYQSAFEKEKKYHNLKRELRINLIQNYAEILRIKGDIDKAMEVLDYGLSFDDTYPMYFWIKARIYANMGDEDNTVKMLYNAKINEKNLLPNEKLPDPRGDEAFKILGIKLSFREKVTQIFNPPKEEKTKENSNESK